MSHNNISTIHLSFELKLYLLNIQLYLEINMQQLKTNYLMRDATSQEINNDKNIKQTCLSKKKVILVDKNIYRRQYY